MNRMNAIIIDDEPIARSIIQKYLNDVPNVELIESFGNAIDADAKTIGMTPP